MTQDIIAMSQKELYRVEIIQNLIEKRLVETQAADQLGLSVRQVRRMKQAYLVDGARGLVTKKRGKPSNRKYPEAIKEVALMYVQEHYHDFRPTFACEKLAQNHSIHVSNSHGPACFCF